MFGTNRSARLEEVKDGTSNSIAVGEVPLDKSAHQYRPLWGQGRHVGVFGRVILDPTPTHVNNCRYRINAANDCDLANTGKPYAWVFSSTHDGGPTSHSATEASGSSVRTSTGSHSSA